MHIGFEESCLTEDSMKKAIKEFFNAGSIAEQRISSRCVRYSGFYDNDDLVIYFRENECDGWNGTYESSILDGEIITLPQEVDVSPDKFALSIELYNLEVDFMLYLQQSTGCDAYIYSDLHNDLCCIRGGKAIWNRNVEFIDDRLKRAAQ